MKTSLAGGGETDTSVPKSLNVISTVTRTSRGRPCWRRSRRPGGRRCRKGRPRSAPATLGRRGDHQPGTAPCRLTRGGRMRLCRSPRKAHPRLASSWRCCGTATGCCYVTDLPGAVGTPASGTCPVGTWSPGNCPARHLLESFERSWASTSRCPRLRPCMKLQLR